MEPASPSVQGMTADPIHRFQRAYQGKEFSRLCLSLLIGNICRLPWPVAGWALLYKAIKAVDANALQNWRKLLLIVFHRMDRGSSSSNDSGSGKKRTMKQHEADHDEL